MTTMAFECIDLSSLSNTPLTELNYRGVELRKTSIPIWCDQRKQKQKLQ